MGLNYIYLQYYWWQGPNNLAISNRKQTLYACNLLHWGPDMLVMSKVVLESRDNDCWTNLAKTNFRWLQAYLVPNARDCKHIKCVDTFMLTSLASHSLFFPCKECVLRVNIKVSMRILVCFGFEIASIFSPLCNWDCLHRTHILS